LEHTLHKKKENLWVLDGPLKRGSDYFDKAENVSKTPKGEVLQTTYYASFMHTATLAFFRSTDWKRIYAVYNGMAKQIKHLAQHHNTRAIPTIAFDNFSLNNQI
jgi:hypothetical protein